MEHEALLIRAGERLASASPIPAGVVAGIEIGGHDGLNG